VHDAILQASQEYGIDPSVALAIAERESSFNVHGTAPGSSAYGLFQLLRKERAQYGGSSDDPLEQARAWGSYITDVNREMEARLGRPPTGEETYLAHYFGSGRASRLSTGQIDPQTPVSHVFTPEELSANPNIVRAGTTGALTSSISNDISRRRARWGGEDDQQPRGFAQFGEEPGTTTFSQFGEEPPKPAEAPQAISPGPVSQWGPQNPIPEIVGVMAESNVKGNGWFDRMLRNETPSTNIEDRRGEPASFDARWPGYGDEFEPGVAKSMTPPS